MRATSLRVCLALLISVAFLATGVFAQSPPAPPQAPVAPPAQEKDEDALPSIEETVKDMEKIDGFYTLYRDKNKLYAFIRNDQIGEEFLMATSIARGRVFFGWQWSEALMVWRRNEKQLMLVVPDVWHRAEEASPIAAAVQSTYTETVIRTVPILAEDPKGNIVIDLGKLYMHSPEAFFGEIVKTTDPSLARFNKIKAFPHNLEVAVDVYPVEKKTGYASLMTLHYSLAAIPPSNYKPRLADDRIGYFLTAVKDFSKSPREETRFVRYINRWHLEKADPELELSPPKNPIVFYLDKNIPVRYRRYVREGILEWNKAFEKVGIVDAMVVRQQTETNEFAAFDPEDARYNFIRWITSDIPYAMGPSRANPRTGQILDADIVFDDALMRWVMSDYDIMIEEGLEAALPPELRTYLEEHPELDPGRFLRTRREARVSEARENRTGFHDPVARQNPYAKGGPLDLGALHGRGLCTIGHGKSHQMAMAALALAALAGTRTEGEEGVLPGDEWPEELVGQFVREIVMHEVGHTLGLRHNFKASSWRQLASLNQPGDQQLSGSVMDYNPLNLHPEGERQAPYLNTTLGPYDYWAIEYGYTILEAAKPENEVELLEAVTSRVAEPELAYATDEDVWGVDPLVNAWDLGSDPLAFADSRLALFNKLKSDLVERAVAEGESYARVRQALNTILWDLQYASAIAARYVGGSYLHRDHRGDPGDRNPLEVVPVAKQRQALAMVTETVLSDTAFQFSSDLLNKLTAGRWWHWGSPDPWLDPSYELHDRVLTVQMWTLFWLMNPVNVRHIYDAELRVVVGQEAMTLPELFGTLTDAIFKEVSAGVPANVAYTNRRPYVSSIRRNLQREYINVLTQVSLSTDASYPRAGRTLAWDHLRQLGEAIDAMGDMQGLDDYTASHLRECRERIKRAVDAQFLMRG